MERFALVRNNIFLVWIGNESERPAWERACDAESSFVLHIKYLLGEYDTSNVLYTAENGI